jgi:peptidoglycan-associated lipoprotein
MTKPHLVTAALLVSAALSCACSHALKPAQVAAAPPGAIPVAPVANTAVEQAKRQLDTSTATIVLSDEIREQCGVSDEDAYFPFDSARLSGKAEKVLDQVAACLEHGKLSGHTLRLVGRADPRGDSEYNLLLGDRRAWAVERTLVRFGMKPRHLTVTSRGDFDATGTDESSWALDRRVDVLLSGVRRPRMTHGQSLPRSPG